MVKRKNKTPLKEYWERKLNINYQVELEYYKKLCGEKYDQKILGKKYDVNIELITYREWERTVSSTIYKLNIEELEEYSRFLNQICRDNDLKFGLSQTLIIPYTICLAGVFSGMLINEIINSARLEGTFGNILVFIGIIILFWFIVSIFRKMFTFKEEQIRKYFFQDFKQIVDDRIKSISKI